jgi:hypothetical protein
MPTDFFDKYREYCNMCNQHVEPRPYKCVHQVNFTNTFHMIAMVEDIEGKYNCIVSKNPVRMEKINTKTYRIKLSKMFDAYGNKLQINMYPNETIEKVEMKINNEVLEKLENPNGLDFSFTNNMYFTYPFLDITVEVTFGVIQYEQDRIVWIDAFSYYIEEKNNFARIGEKIFFQDNKLVEYTNDEKAVEYTFCPNCKDLIM